MTETPQTRHNQSALRAFLSSEAAGGILLMAAAALALLVANSPFADNYAHFVHAITGPELTPKLGPMTVHLWINDGLMAVFFLLVGLEIKREFVDGHLSTWSDRRLPIIAAAAGMVFPALIYLGVAGGDPDLHRGWAIPAATDIAFAIGVLALLGSRAPASLKLFLMTVAIVDDMGAVAIIALFYTAELNIMALAAAGAIWLTMMALNRFRVNVLWPYLILAALLWYATLLSGVHATIAGVMAAFAVPFRCGHRHPVPAGLCARACRSERHGFRRRQRRTHGAQVVRQIAHAHTRAELRATARVASQRTRCAAGHRQRLGTDRSGRRCRRAA